MMLLAAFAVIWTVLAVAPVYRQDWLLENALVLVLIPVLVGTYRRAPLSHGAYLALFVFLTVHEIGAHYTYSQVPYEQWLSQMGLPRIASGRNDYDRLAHFLYGLLVTPAAAELLTRVAATAGLWRWLLPVSFVMSHSLCYELLEWAAAIQFGGNLGAAYLGTQGDPWDSQRDMLAATLGSMATMTLLIAVQRARGSCQAVPSVCSRTCDRCQSNFITCQPDCRFSSARN